MLHFESFFDILRHTVKCFCKIKMLRFIPLVTKILDVGETDRCQLLHESFDDLLLTLVEIDSCETD